ncbi:DUF2442 domain-containing protein [Agrobacterium cavarae]|uniref:DUF2442 domain-containing protein n=1 Tax=Agrobacterium cavarae TaxID=2528239 RepID=UPI0028AB397C|nr:DUF2442 domain-containing protein [Agrobacterium cavarae]
MTKKRSGKTRGAAGHVAGDQSALKSFGSGLDDIGIKPLGRRIIAERVPGVGSLSSVYQPAQSVKFEASSGTILIEFEDAPILMVAARRLKQLMRATDSEIADVELKEGSLLLWRHLDVTLEVKSLLSGKSSADSLMLLRGPTEFNGTGELDASSEWPALVVQFLSSNLPGSRETGWYHDFSTAYQIGCETLVALGQAADTSIGAMPLKTPRFPDVLPRTDDVAVAVIYLATQNGLLTFPSHRMAFQSRKPPDGKDRAHFRESEAWTALAHPQTVEVLRALGMIEGDRWTGPAETIWWRDDPSEWALQFKSDFRFEAAVNHACECIPDHIRTAMNDIIEISDEDIESHSSAGTDHIPENTARVARLSPKTREEIIRTIRWIRSKDFDCLFYKYWRLNDGWLSTDAAGRALEIFNDPLAISMRKAVVLRLFPDFPELAK